MASGDDAQRLNKGGAAAKALFGTFGERARQHQVEFGRFVRRQRRRRRRRRLHVRHDQLRRCAREGHNAGDDFVSDNRQRVEIAASINALRRRLLRRNIFWRSHENAGTGQTLTVRRLRDAEVGQQNAPFDIDQDIMRLDVAVNGALRMGVVECISDWRNDADRHCQTERAAFADNRVQRSSANIFHGDVSQTVRFANVVHGDDIRMAEIRNRYRLTFKAPLEFRVERQMRRHDLERNGAFERSVECAVYARHTAAPDLFLHQIAAKVLTNEAGHSCSCIAPTPIRDLPSALLVTR